ncbi:MAG: hypothetical protein HZC37_05005 [Burkholderiales bacterium]|nr:hypothetical protein [Burkholderiales bacterium]
MGLTYRSRLALLVLFPQLWSCGGGGDSSPPDSSVGPEGGELAVNPSDPAYGFKIVIPAGALSERRTIVIDGFLAAYPPTLPGPGLHRYAAGAVGLRTHGDKPYGLAMTVHAPLGTMAMAAGEIACLFGYDASTDTWHLMVPDAVARDAAGSARISVTTTYHDYFAWGKVVLSEIPEVYLRQVVDARFGGGISAAAAAELARIAQRSEFAQVSPNRASLLAFRNGFLELFKQGQATYLLAEQAKLGACGTACDVLSDRFLDDAMSYAGNLIRIKWWSFFVGDISTIADVLMWIHLINLYAANERFPCNYKCVTETCGGTFWQVYAGYWFAVICQELIDTAIANGWVD